MKQIVIDPKTRSEVRMLFGLNSTQMTRILQYHSFSIRARKVRSYILNYRDYHIISNDN